MTTKNSNFPSIAEIATNESLRDWFKKEKWVRISSSGKIAGDCGTSKNKKNPDRCLPKAKAQSLTKGQRAATAAKKKKAGAKGKTVVKNTKKAKVTKEGLWANINAKKKAGKKSSHGNSNAYKAAKKAGNKLKEGKSAEELKTNIATLQKARAMAARSGKETLVSSLHIAISKAQKELKKLSIKKETKGAPKGHYFTKSGNLVKGTLSKDAKEKGARLSDPKDKQRSKVPPVTQYKENVTLEDIKNLTIGLLHEVQGKEILMEKDDRCTRLAKSKYDTWPSAYASGAVVRCRRGEIWKKK